MGCLHRPARFSAKYRFAGRSASSITSSSGLPLRQLSHGPSEITLSKREPEGCFEIRSLGSDLLGMRLGPRGSQSGSLFKTAFRNSRGFRSGLHHLVGNTNEILQLFHFVVSLLYLNRDLILDPGKI